MSVEIQAPRKWKSYTASDTQNIADVIGGHKRVKAVRFNTAGNAVIVDETDNTETFAVSAGETVVVNPKRINATSTTAGGIIILYD